MKKILYTFVMDYKGGTYVEQVIAPSVKAAQIMWAKKLDLGVMGVRESERNPLIAECKSEESRPVLVNGVSAVWCIAPDILDKVATVHIIQTVTPKVRPEYCKHSRNTSRNVTENDRKLRIPH